MDGQDRRVKRTHRLLAQALIDLTLEKGYEAVTIRDITERADVGYATFFRHYADKDALLEDVLTVVLDKLMVLLEEHPAIKTPEGCTLVFQFVGEHCEVCRVLLSSRGSSALVNRIITTSTQSILESNPPQAASPIPPEIAAHHIVASSLALIQWWLDNGMPYPPERMGVIYHALIIRPTHTIAFEG